MAEQECCMVQVLCWVEGLAVVVLPEGEVLEGLVEEVLEVAGLEVVGNCLSPVPEKAPVIIFLPE